MTSEKSVFIRNCNPAVLKLEAYVAGPTTEEVTRLSGVPSEDIVKLSSNENPLGPSLRAVEAIREAAVRVSLYPSSRCERLREAIAGVLGKHLTPENILVAAGSSEIFSFIIRAFSSSSNEILFACPSFPVYGDAATIDGGVPIQFDLNEPLFDFTSSAIMQHCSDRTRIVFVTRPNNPTSRLTPLDEVRKTCELMEDSVVVCDEAYIEFADDYAEASAVNLLDELDNLLVTRTFSKAYGLSDLRVGYVVGPPEAIGILFKFRPKWNNGELAQEAAIAALSDREHLKRTLATVKEGRRFLVEQLEKMGFVVTPEPQGNFIFASPSPLRLEAGSVRTELMKRGVSVRGPPTDWKLNYLRISVGTRTQNEKLVAAISSIVNRR
jgi:histidinol-phosphate aminotransferase